MIGKYGKYSDFEIAYVFDVLGGTETVDRILGLKRSADQRTVVRKPSTPGTREVVCEILANRCSICGAHAVEGEEACIHGHHHGRKYPIVAVA